ncbi:MAG: gfo/Idh/MocA family oxidoreductase, partial [Eubacteriales bacterium]
EKTDRRGIIHGDKGYIEIENINNCEALKVFDINGELVKELEIPEQITGFEYEVRACMEALKAGQLECSQMPHDEIITVMEVMDTLRAEWGVVYPFE